MRFKRKALAQRIRSEMPELDRAVEAVLRHWERAKAAPEDKDAFLNSVTLNLHGFYNGIERALELIVVDLDGAALGGDAWHTEPLRQVELEVPCLRPAVISSETRRRLDEYRRFRHRLRNIYATNLNASPTRRTGIAAHVHVGGSESGVFGFCGLLGFFERRRIDFPRVYIQRRVVWVYRPRYRQVRKVENESLDRVNDSAYIKNDSDYYLNGARRSTRQSTTREADSGSGFSSCCKTQGFIPPPTGFTVN